MTFHPPAVRALTWPVGRGVRCEEVQEGHSVLPSAAWQAVGEAQGPGELWMAE